jgi:smad nuclear-interacting protein 1
MWARDWEKLSTPEDSTQGGNKMSERRRSDERYREKEDRGRERDTDRDREYSSRNRHREHDDGRRRPRSPPAKVKREDSPRHPSGRSRSPSPYSRRPRPRSRSPSPWGAHQHDLSHDRAPSPKKPKQKPNYGLSGLLAAATNTKNGIVLKYNEPPEARKVKGWRLYVFKKGEEVDCLELGVRSSYLVGRERTVC